LACAPESKELLAVKSARSIVSEWELVNREAAAGRLTRVYVDGMRGEATSQLRSQARASSSMVTPAALEIAQVSRLAGDTSPEMLHHALLRLRTIENQLGPS
jgi:hypothetical protein